MMTVGLHCRIVGKPGRTQGLIKFLDYVRSKVRRGCRGGGRGTSNARVTKQISLIPDSFISHHFASFHSSQGNEVWVARRDEIANHWYRNHYPEGYGEPPKVELVGMRTSKL